MRGTKTSIAKTLLFVSAATVLSAATPEYFPLQVGNSWVYRASVGRLNRVQTISVDAIESVNGRAYFRVQFFERSLLVRTADDGSLYEYDPESRQERLWLPFAAAEGQKTDSQFEPCTKSATVRSKSAKVKGPLGEFDNVLQLTYEPVCGDAGVSYQYFLPYIGLLEQESSNIAGAHRHELIYSRTGSTAVDVNQVAFTVALDAQTYRAREDTEMFVRLTLRNTRPEPVILNFPSGQSFDVKLYNAQGDTVYVWSADKLFLQAVRTERISGERSWALTIPIADLAPGRYTAEVLLTTQPRSYSAVAAFEVR